MGIHCEACGFRTFDHGNAIKWLRSARRAQLPRSDASLFFVGSFAIYSLCMTRARWLELKPMRGLSAWRSQPLLVVDEANCLRNPILPSVADRVAWARRMGRPFNFLQWAED